MFQTISLVRAEIITSEPQYRAAPDPVSLQSLCQFAESLISAIVYYKQNKIKLLRLTKKNLLIFVQFLLFLPHRTNKRQYELQNAQEVVDMGT